jgi:hypothetical protein
MYYMEDDLAFAICGCSLTTRRVCLIETPTTARGSGSDSKEEHHGELVAIGGVVHKIGKSTKGREALTAFLERVMD